MNWRKSISLGKNGTTRSNVNNVSDSNSFISVKLKLNQTFEDQKWYHLSLVYEAFYANVPEINLLII